MFICTGIHKKEVKLREVVRLSSLYTIFTKQRGFGLQGSVSCGEVTKEYMENSREINVVFVRFVYADSFWC